MTTVYGSGDSCPRCGKPVKDIWGPADEKVQTFAGTKVRHRVVNTLRCDACGWHRVEEVTDTDKQLTDLLQSLKPLA